LKSFQNGGTIQDGGFLTFYFQKFGINRGNKCQFLYVKKQKKEKIRTTQKIHMTAPCLGAPKISIIFLYRRENQSKQKPEH
jgi:hypothetical protein